jgi:ubiquitin-like-specific protease 1C/D
MQTVMDLCRFVVGQEDEEGEDAGRKYSPCSSGKKNYGVV